MQYIEILSPLKVVRLNKPPKLPNLVVLQFRDIKRYSITVSTPDFDSEGVGSIPSTAVKLNILYSLVRIQLALLGE